MAEKIRICIHNLFTNYVYASGKQGLKTSTVITWWALKLQSTWDIRGLIIDVYKVFFTFLSRFYDCFYNLTSTFIRLQAGRRCNRRAEIHCECVFGNSEQ